MRSAFSQIPPELREDWGEIELAQKHKLPRLIELSDLKGDLHVHSDWSDGGGTIEEMARAAMALGHEYIALTDHSKSLGVARGLTDERVLEQRRVLDALNERLAPFRILHGTEMDIKRDGALDYDDEILAVFDYVSASIHSAMNQEQAIDDGAHPAGARQPLGRHAEPSARSAGRLARAVRGRHGRRDRHGSRARGSRWRSTASRSGWIWTALSARQGPRGRRPLHDQHGCPRHPPACAWAASASGRPAGPGSALRTC